MTTSSTPTTTSTGRFTYFSPPRPDTRPRTDGQARARSRDCSAPLWGFVPVDRSAGGPGLRGDEPDLRYPAEESEGRPRCRPPRLRRTLVVTAVRTCQGGDPPCRC